MRSKLLRAPVLIGVIAALLVLLYSIATAYPYLRGPILSVNVPGESAQGTTITGHTTRVRELSVNGFPVALDEHGAFSIVRAYPVGYTVVVVSARDRFGRARERTLTFVTKPYGTQKNEGRVSTSTEDREADVSL